MALRNYEHLLRQTLAAGGGLITLATEAQADRGLDPTTGHQIFEAFVASNLDISTALSRTARGHRQLDVMAQAMGIDLTGYGKTSEPPKPGAQIFTGADASKNTVDC